MVSYKERDRDNWKRDRYDQHRDHSSYWEREKRRLKYEAKRDYNDYYWRERRAYWRNYSRYPRPTYTPIVIDPIYTIPDPVYYPPEPMPSPEPTPVKVDFAALVKNAQIMVTLSQGVYDSSADQLRTRPDDSFKTDTLNALSNLILAAQKYSTSMNSGGAVLENSIYDVLALEDAMLNVAPYLHQQILNQQVQDNVDLVANLINQNVWIYRDNISDFDKYRYPDVLRIVNAGIFTEVLASDLYKKVNSALQSDNGGPNDKVVSAIWDIVTAITAYNGELIKTNNDLPSTLNALLYVQDMVNDASSYIDGQLIGQRAEWDYYLIKYYVEDLLWIYDQQIPQQ